MAENWEAENNRLAEEYSNSIPQPQLGKCHGAIQTACVAAGAAGLIPLPFADAVPIVAAQSAMIIALGAIFNIHITKSVAKSVIMAGIATQGGRHIASNLLKFIPGLGSVAGAATAVGVTQLLGWTTADDFYRISVGKDPKFTMDLLNLIQRP
ncbi:MAG: DUF697 domain-containing protein [Firmicutes bacterium]|nr:DUF697 domain-containing protein [Bacillota bacterium]